MRSASLALAACFVAALLCGSNPLLHAQLVPLPVGAQAEAQAIDPERLRVHVKTLSSDKFEGRGPGQPGGELATQYIADAFRSYGLVPAGDHGTFTQQVPLVGVTPVAAETQFRLVPLAGSRTKAW